MIVEDQKAIKLLLFSDIHMSKSHCERLCELAETVDIVVGAGDFGAMRHGISKTISWLSEIGGPAILVPGNAESFEELQQSCIQWPSATVLHGTGTVVMGIPFFGIGGGVPITPFGSWSYDFTEEQANQLLASCPKGAVLVSHSPPYGILDVSSRGLHVGSTAVRNVIATKSPILVVCGHIHESAGQLLKVGATEVINAGPAGYLYQLDLPV